MRGEAAGAAQVLRVEPDGRPLAIIEGGGDARAVVWPGMGARHRSMHYLALPAGARTRPLRHAHAEAVYYIIRGEGEMEDLDARSVHPVGPGAFVFVTVACRYRITARTALTCVGGPCPPDPTLYEEAL